MNTPEEGEALSPSSFTPQLRPLSIGEVLDAGFSLFRHRFGKLVVAVLVPFVPLAILGTLIVASTDDRAFDVNATETNDSGAAIAGNLVGLVIQGAALALAVAACFKIISAAYLGEQTTVGESLRYGAGRILALIVAYIVLGIVLTISAFLLLIPAIYFGVKFALTFPAIVFERKGPFSAIGRSWQLTRENWWRTFGTLFVVALLMFVISIALSLALGAAIGAADMDSEVVFAILTTLVNIGVIAVTYPLGAAILTVIYYDLRVRHEGFDLQLLARGVGADESRFAGAPERPAPPPAPAPPAGEPSAGGFAPPQGPATSA
jgi:hypothetical protein